MFVCDDDLVDLCSHELIVTLTGAVIHLPLAYERFHPENLILMMDFGYFLKSLKIPNLLTQEFDLIGCAYSVYNPNLYFHAVVTHPKLEAGWVGLLWGGVNTTAFYKGAVFAPKYCITIMLQHTHFKVPDS